MKGGLISFWMLTRELVPSLAKLTVYFSKTAAKKTFKSEDSSVLDVLQRTISRVSITAAGDIVFV